MHLRITAEVVTRTDVRLGPELSEEEKTFRDDRRLIVYNTMKSKFAESFAKKLQSETDVPTIAVLGSGGGFRATVGYSGAMAGLQRSGIFDMVTYCAGLSGSAWYLSTLYSHPEWPGKTVKEIADTELKESIVSNSWGRSKPGFIGQLLYHFLVGKSFSGNYTVTDALGKLLGDILLRGRSDCKLTDQKSKIENGKCPMPIYSSIHVKNDTSAKTFHEWVEYTPYEIGLPKYKLSLAPEKFGSRFFSGRQIGESVELPLRYLQGIWGSAYSIQLWRLAVWQKDNKTPTIEDIRNADQALADQSIRLEYGLPTPEESNPEDRPNFFVRGWNSFTSVLKDNMPLLNTIHMRSARILSFLKDLNIDSPADTPDAAGVLYEPREIMLKIDYSHIFERFPTNETEMYMVDAGIAFNSPYPPVLRRRREVDLILSFDFSARNSNDINDIFGELLKAESWLDVCHCPFPNIQSVLPSKQDGNGSTVECYIFENKEEPACPIVMHFVLVNNQLKNQKLDRDDKIVKRNGEKEKKFGDFQVFDDPKDTYGTFNLKYDDEAYERLWQLMEFNTVLYKDEIIEMIGKCIVNKKKRQKKKEDKAVLHGTKDDGNTSQN